VALGPPSTGRRVPAPDASSPPASASASLLPPDPTTATPAVDLVADEALSFAKAWARPDYSSTWWLKGLAPYVTPRLYRELAKSNPADVPAGAVAKGEPVVREGSAVDTAIYSVGCVGMGFQPGRVILTFDRTPDGWLVDQVAYVPAGIY
jgi:hypothetical protein